MSFFTLKTSLRRFLNRYIHVSGSSSYPYLSGDGFRSIAHVIYDQFLDFDPTKVAYGDIVFVRNSALLDFFTKIHPRITTPYVLISHNEDSTIGESYVSYIDENILHWYCLNLNFKHPKVTVLPIGIQNYCVGYPDNFVQLYLDTRKQLLDTPAITTARKHRILYAFTLDPRNSERAHAFEVLSNAPLAETISVPRTEYYATLATYTFIACPRGNGIDCHRIWESLYLNVIPILIRNDFSEQLAESGFPVLLIDSWEKLLTLDEEFLRTYYETHKEGFNSEKLFLRYWYDTFASFKRPTSFFQSGDMSRSNQ